MVICSGKLPQVQLGAVYQCVIAAQQAYRCTFVRTHSTSSRGADKSDSTLGCDLALFQVC